MTSIDPGHGAVYADAGHRRCQEWFAACKLGDAIADILTSRFKMPADRVFWTRTAGFALIAPDALANAGAPELGAARYVVDIQDPADRSIKARTNPAVLADDRLRTLSDLLFTELSAADVPQPVAPPARSSTPRKSPGD